MVFVASTGAIRAPDRRQLVRRAIKPNVKDDLVAGKALEPKPPGVLQFAYGATGLATTAAWTHVVVDRQSSQEPFSRTA